jgi:hypothetical protein
LKLAGSARRIVFDEHVDAIGKWGIQQHASKRGSGLGLWSASDLQIARAQPLNGETGD